MSAVTGQSDVAINIVVTAVTTVLSNEVLRRVTFRCTGAGSVARGQSAGTEMATVGLAANSLAVAGWNALVPGANPVAIFAVLYCVNGLVGLANFVVLRRSLAGSRRRSASHPATALAPVIDSVRRGSPASCPELRPPDVHHHPTQPVPEQGQPTMTSQPVAITRAAGDGPDVHRDAMSELAVLERLGTPRAVLTRFFLEYKFGIEEVRTKVLTLQEEFLALHEYNPIEHVTSRLKTSQSLLHRMSRKGCELSLESARAAVTDIAELRVTGSLFSTPTRSPTCSPSNPI